VPRVTGRKVRAAKHALHVAHCDIGFVRRQSSAKPKGRVIKQTPRAGRRLPAGSTVDLVVSRGKRP
jgi:eukaryotic-like serine/threonine-protein kinase